MRKDKKDAARGALIVAGLCFVLATAISGIASGPIVGALCVMGVCLIVIAIFETS